FRKKIEEYSPNFIYQRFSGKTFFVCRLAKKLGIPIILEVNGFGDWLSNFDIYRKNLLKKFLNNIFRKKVLHLIENYNFKNSSIIVTVSKVIKNNLTEIGVPEEKILIMPNGVDTDKFNHKISNSTLSKRIKRELKISKNNRIVGFAGTFGPWHGIENLVSAVSKIEENNKNKDIIFLLMGDGVLKKYAVDKISKFNNVIIF
ncbi:unnamed protein product, partial [marine sediment metagenome]